MRGRDALGPVLAAALACTTAGRFEGDMAPPADEPAVPTTTPASQDHARFSWTSSDGGQSGDMKVALATGETFTGTFHQITRTTTATRIDGFYGSWYGGPWGYPAWGWGWGGAWPYYDDPRAFIVHYSGKVLALLHSSRGNAMRCRFELLDAVAGIDEGGVGECQIGDGRRITAWFGPSEGEWAPVSRR